MPLIHYGWDVSPYSAKTRTYLRFKKIPHEDRHPNAWKLMRTIKAAVGRPVMPTIHEPGPDGGSWIQDTSDIIDTLEARHPTPEIHPAGPSQRLASYLMELHADEWLPTVIMHTRWNYPASVTFAVAEFAREGLPGWPTLISHRLIQPMADRMAAYRPKLGITPETIPGIESYSRELIARLDAHFAVHDYLLGGRPCLGDFALFGPLWSHVWRDPGTTHWFDGADAVLAWFERMQAPPAPGEWLADDAVPETLDAIYRTMFEEQWAYLAELVAVIDTWAEANSDARRLPRALGDQAFTIGGKTGTRRLITFSQWMLQRSLDVYGETDGGADEWLTRVGGVDAMKLVVTHRMTRKDFKEVLVKTPAEALQGAK
jgi:glutathione S-transferase